MFFVLLSSNPASFSHVSLLFSLPSLFLSLSLSPRRTHTNIHAHKQKMYTRTRTHTHTKNLPYRHTQRRNCLDRTIWRALFGSTLAGRCLECRRHKAHCRRSVHRERRSLVLERLGRHVCRAGRWISCSDLVVSFRFFVFSGVVSKNVSDEKLK